MCRDVPLGRLSRTSLVFSDGILSFLSLGHMPKDCLQEGNDMIYIIISKKKKVAYRTEEMV